MTIQASELRGIGIRVLLICKNDLLP